MSAAEIARSLTSKQRSIVLLCRTGNEIDTTNSDWYEGAMLKLFDPVPYKYADPALPDVARFRITKLGVDVLIHLSRR